MKTGSKKPSPGYKQVTAYACTNCLEIHAERKDAAKCCTCRICGAKSEDSYCPPCSAKASVARFKAALAYHKTEMRLLEKQIADVLAER
jgi:hypothetical protein